MELISPGPVHMPPAYPVAAADHTADRPPAVTTKSLSVRSNVPARDKVPTVRTVRPPAAGSATTAVPPAATVNEPSVCVPANATFAAAGTVAVSVGAVPTCVTVVVAPAAKVSGTDAGSEPLEASIVSAVPAGTVTPVNADRATVWADADVPGAATVHTCRLAPSADNSRYADPVLASISDPPATANVPSGPAATALPVMSNTPLAAAATV